MESESNQRNASKRPHSTRESWDSLGLFDKVAGGGETAADAVFHRYAQRLILLARSRLSRKLAARIDPEDVVMSAYRSFFVRARDGKFQIENSGDLWRLLVEITCHKLYRQAAHHRAGKRSIDAELPQSSEAEDRLVGSETEPAMAALLADEIEFVMTQLNETGRRSLQLRLQDYTIDEIAAEVGVSERTIRRQLANAKSLLIERTPNEDAIDRADRPTSKAIKPTPIPSSFSDYRLLQQIGVGATGKVYRALQHSTENECAIKYLRKEFSSDRQAVERFDREAETLTKIEHPGVIRIQGHGMTPGDGRFLVMELIEGGDLQSRLDAGAIEIDQAVDWIAQACEAITAASAQGIVHCDLKPANLLLRETDEVVVTDFGFARDIRNSVAPSFAGTPAFMAPEQIDLFYGPIDERTDVYGLGMCLYALLAKRTAFEADDPYALMGKIVSGEPPRDPRELREEVSAELSEICLKAIAKKPDARFRSAVELRDALWSHFAPSK